MVNTDDTLHLLLVSPRDWVSRLSDLAQVWQPNDQLLLMAAAVQGHASELLLPFAEQHPVGLYEPDALQIQLLTPRLGPLPAHLHMVSSELWATWTLQHARCMTWRA